MKYPALLLVIFLASCGSVRYLGNSSQTISPAISHHSGTDSFIYPYAQLLNQQMNDFVCVLDTSYAKSKPNGNLNNLVANLVLNYAQGLNVVPTIHFCVLNFGGLRASLPADTITLRNIYELSPFQNQLTILKLNTSAVDSLFNYLRQRTGDPLAGITLSQPVTIQGMAYDSRRPYYLVTNDYMANGGDGFNMLRNASFRYTCSQTQRQAILEQLRLTYSQHQSIPHYHAQPYP